jgi:hypothetical protein
MRRGALCLGVRSLGRRDVKGVKEVLSLKLWLIGKLGCVECAKYF